MDMDIVKLIADNGIGAIIALIVILRVDKRLAHIEQAIVSMSERDRKRRKREGDPDANTPVAIPKGSR